jgi:hypothetical protein
MANWNKSEFFDSIQSFYKHLKALKVDMLDDTDATHDLMPKVFFETYRSDFTGPG